MTTAETAPPAPRRQTLDQLRGAVCRAAERTSYRLVAGEIGLSPRAAQQFAEGKTRPRSRTVELVRAWEARQRAGADHAAIAVVETLLAPLPHTVHAACAAAIAAVVVRLYREHGMTPPGWAIRLTARPDPGRPSPARHERASAPDPTPREQTPRAAP